MSLLTNKQIDALAPGRASGPDFLCIGQQKAGTQWLYDMLQFQPEFWMTPVKELNVFKGRFPIEKMQKEYSKMKKNLKKLNKKRDGNTLRSLDHRDLQFFEHAVTYARKNASLEWYRGLFAPKGNLLSGDVSPSYSILDHGTIARLAEALPDLLLILLLRDPVSRAWSGFNMRTRNEIIGRGSKEPGADSVSAFYRPTSVEQVADYLNRGTVRERSFATVIYENWRRHFDASQIKLVFFDDIVKSPGIARQSVLEFFDLRDTGSSAAKVAPDFNRKAENLKRPMSDDVRGFLIDTFRQELLRCADMFGGPAKQWPRRYCVA